MPSTTPTRDTDRDRGIDPDDPPADCEQLWVAPARNSSRHYHVEESCELLNGRGVTRRVEIAAAWYPPCRACVCDGGLNAGVSDTSTTSPYSGGHP